MAEAVLTRILATQTAEDIDLVIFDNGLLMVPVSAPPPSPGRGRKAVDARRAETIRAETLLAGSFKGLRGRPGVAWLDADNILGARLRSWPKWTLTLDLPDGLPLLLRATTLTTEVGAPQAALSALLAERVAG